MITDPASFYDYEIQGCSSPGNQASYDLFCQGTIYFILDPTTPKFVSFEKSSKLEVQARHNLNQKNEAVILINRGAQLPIRAIRKKYAYKKKGVL